MRPNVRFVTLIVMIEIHQHLVKRAITGYMIQKEEPVKECREL